MIDGESVEDKEKEPSKLKTTYSKGGIVGMNIEKPMKVKRFNRLGEEVDEYGMTEEEAEQFNKESKERLVKQRNELIGIKAFDHIGESAITFYEPVETDYFKDYGTMRSCLTAYADGMISFNNKIKAAIEEAEDTLEEELRVLVENTPHLLKLRKYIDDLTRKSLLSKRKQTLAVDLLTLDAE